MFIAFPIILFTLLAIGILALISFYLVRLIKKKTAFDQLLLGALGYIFINSFFAFMIELYFVKEPWLDRLMPFALGYGPFLYFGVLALKYNRIKGWQLLLHFTPFLIYLFAYLGLLFGLLENTLLIRQTFSDHIFVLGCISFIGYALWSAIQGKQVFKDKLKMKLIMFVFARILLLFLALIFIIIHFSNAVAGNQQAIYFLRMIVYSCMLVIVLMIFSYAIHKLFKVNRQLATDMHPQLEEAWDDGGGIAKPTLLKYERSPLSVKQLMAYQEKLAFAVSAEQIYLDQNLSLSSLAQHLKIPKHHLTQVFGVQIKQTFYQYINGFRVAHACVLLGGAGKSINIEELAEKSGFNSKVSFNRHFKLLQGCTPSEYRAKLG